MLWMNRATTGHLKCLGLRTPRPATEPRNGPTRNFHEKYRKNTPRPEILDSQNLPPKYPENTEKIPRKYRKCVFLVFFRYFWGIFLGFQNFGPGVLFLYFSWKFRVGPFRGSVAGRGVLKPGRGSEDGRFPEVVTLSQCPSFVFFVELLCNIHNGSFFVRGSFFLFFGGGGGWIGEGEPELPSGAVRLHAPLSAELTGQNFTLALTLISSQN